MGQDMTYVSQRDKALETILTMADELLRLDSEVQALEAENRRLRAQAVVLSSAEQVSSTEQIGMGAIERRVFELGCEKLINDCFYTWNNVTQSPDAKEKTPCSFELWRKSTFRNMYQPDWISVDQLYEVLDPQLRKLYAEKVKEFMEAEDDE